MNTHSSPPSLLAVGAHPDDLEFGMGGVLIKQKRAGIQLSLVLTSKGESGSSGAPDIRVREACVAARFLGVEDRLSFLDFGGDGRQRAAVENTIALAQVMRETRPSMVFAPDPSPNQHPDHAVVGAITRDACRLARYGGIPELKDTPAHAVDSLWFYAISPHPDRDLAAAVLVDISDAYEDWKALMGCHQTQVSSRKYMDLQVARARQLGLLAGCEYATALWPNDPPVVGDIRVLSRTARAF